MKLQIHELRDNLNVQIIFTSAVANIKSQSTLEYWSTLI